MFHYLDYVAPYKAQNNSHCLQAGSLFWFFLETGGADWGAREFAEDGHFPRAATSPVVFFLPFCRKPGLREAIVPVQSQTARQRLSQSTYNVPWPPNTHTPPRAPNTQPPNTHTPLPHPLPIPIHLDGPSRYFAEDKNSLKHLRGRTLNMFSPDSTEHIFLEWFLCVKRCYMHYLMSSQKSPCSRRIN